MSWTPDTSMKVLGRGSEATVYLDPDSGRAVKHFDRAPIRIARNKATTEFDRLNQAFELSKTSAMVHVPVPGELSTPTPAFSMAQVQGQSLMDLLAFGHVRGEESLRLASHVAEGIRLFQDILADCTLDHIHPNEDGSVTFFDFGNGSEDQEGRNPGDLRSVFENLAGSSLYECSRPGRYRGQAKLDELARFLAELAHNLELSWTDAIEECIWDAFSDRALQGHMSRTLWYRMAGGYTAWRLFRVIRAAMLVAKRQAIDTLFSFVWDFPTDGTPLTNGIHKVVDGLMAHAAETGVTPIVLTLGAERTTIDQGSYSLEVFPKKRWGLPTSLIRRIAQTPNALTMLNGTFNPWNSLMAFALSRRGMDYAMNPHTIMDAGFFSVSRRKKQLYWHLIERRLLNRAVSIISYSAELDAELAHRGVQTPVIESWNGICDPVMPELDTFSTEGPVRFHFFGRVSIQTKGLDLLLEAAAKVSRTEAIEVTIQGPGTDDLPDLYRRVDGLGLNEIVRFVPPASTPNPILIMGGYDVCILPSRYEGFPTALVEAMMAARPIVTTRVGSLAPILEREGIAIVVDTSSEAIAQGMRAVIGQRASWRMTGLAGREWALRHLDWSPIVNQLIADLNQLRQNQA